MKSHVSDWSTLVGKTTIALTILAIIAFIPAPKVSAQPAPQANYLNVPVGGAISCRVDGVTYPVDGLVQIWAIGNGGHWIITGHLVTGSDGYTAVLNDGTQSRAVCE